MVETNLKHGWNISRAQSKHTSSIVEANFDYGRNTFWATVEKYLLHVQIITPVIWNIPRARSKHTFCTAELCLKPGWNIPQARLKHTLSTVENLTRARSKHTSSDGRSTPQATIEKNLKHGWNTSRAWSQPTSSPVETNLERGGPNIPQVS